MAVLLCMATFAFHQERLGLGLLGLGLLTFCLVIALHARFLQLAGADAEFDPAPVTGVAKTEAIGRLTGLYRLG